MILNMRLVEEINKGEDHILNEIALQILELIERNPQDFTRNEEKILEEIREVVWED